MAIVEPRAKRMTDLIGPNAQFLLYQTGDGRTRVEVRFDGDTVWLSLGQLAELFQRDKSVISRHIKNVFEEGELDRAAVVAESATTAADGKTYQVEYCNLDGIISVGYRVKFTVPHLGQAAPSRVHRRWLRSTSRKP